MAFFGFAERLGVRERLLRWDIPLSDEVRSHARDWIPDGVKTLVIALVDNHRSRHK